MGEIAVADIVAVALAFLMWQGFAYLVDSSRWAASSLTAAVNAQRLVWMTRMLDREGRIVDSTLLANLMRSVAFFASATVIILGGVTALLGAGDRGYDAVRTLPFVPAVSRELFEAKILLLGVVFIYSFLKFTWSLRQFNYCCILVGAAPELGAPAEEKASFAKQAARLSELGARSFNQGLGGYYFALASLGWFVHPGAFVGAELLVVLILWRREFRSKTRRALYGIVKA